VVAPVPDDPAPDRDRIERAAYDRGMDVLTHLMFQDGRAREAAEWYVSLVPGSRIERVVETTVYFTLAGREFIAFDSPVQHEFGFTPSTSIFVRCDDEAEVRALFAEIESGGNVLMPVADYGFSSCFGWATDRYGVSWQVGLADRGLAPS
jgi:predicted 3-demethylubiquinone-9 3-methyltransferase (glyoxalase superfamily)